MIWTTTALFSVQIAAAQPTPHTTPTGPPEWGGWFFPVRGGSSRELAHDPLIFAHAFPYGLNSAGRVCGPWALPVSPGNRIWSAAAGVNRPVSGQDEPQDRPEEPASKACRQAGVVCSSGGLDDCTAAPEHGVVTRAAADGLSGTPGGTAARLRGVTKRFGTTVAVDKLDLEVLRGECLGLLGPNGAGKSTTITMLAGIMEPDAGTIELSGKASPRLRSTRRRIGIAPQSLALYPELTAAENLDFFGRVYGLSGPRLRARVDAGLGLARLTESRNERVRTFSGGMARRLNLACAVVHEPDLLLADEPTVGVDPQSRNHLFDCIEALLASGMTVIYSTHYLEEVERLCRRAAIIDHGRILAMDLVPSLIEQHGGTARLRVQFVERPSADLGLPELGPDLDVELITAAPLQQLAQWSDVGLRFRSIDVREPNLESVFLNLTGRSLRD